MRLFCREDHSKQIERNIAVELIEARAELARLKKLPLSAFAQTSYKTIRSTPFGPMTYQVDNKDDAIDRAKAIIAELEVLVEL